MYTKTYGNLRDNNYGWILLRHGKKEFDKFDTLNMGTILYRGYTYNSEYIDFSSTITKLFADYGLKCTYIKYK